MADHRTRTVRSRNPGTLENVTRREENVVQFDFLREQKRRGLRARTILDTPYRSAEAYDPDTLLRACTYEFLYMDLADGVTDDLEAYAVDLLELAQNRLESDRRSAAAHGAVAAIMLAGEEYEGFSSLRRCLYYGREDSDAICLGLSILLHFGEEHGRHPLLVDRRALYTRYGSRSAHRLPPDEHISRLSDFLTKTYGRGTRG